MRIQGRVKCAVAAATVLAFLPIMPGGDVHAESALEFMLRGGAAQFGPRSGPSRYVPYTRYPERVERRAEPRAVEKPRSRDFERVVCERVCDGRRMVMAIQPERRGHSIEEAMCRAAGGEAETRLTVERFVPGSGAHYASARMHEGRAAAGAPCPEEEAGSSLGVPILHDATLRSGDIVATNEGFKVFRGRGQAPHSPRDFVAVDPARLKSGELGRLEVATIP